MGWRILHGGCPAAALLIAVMCTSAHAGIVFDESVSGDLSDDRFAPSALTLESGSNTITGMFGISPVPDMPDLDYVTVTVPVGYELDSFVVLAANVGGAFSFVGMELGDMVSIPYDWPSSESPLLGWAHFGSASVGFDLLPEIGSAPGAVGFDGPLGAGNYTLWIMELETASAYSYSFGLHLTQVPSPGSISLLAFALALCVRRRRA